MRPRLAFAALLTTSLVAVAVPAAAGSSDTSADPAATAPSQPPASPNSTPSPATSPDPGSTSATTADPAAADPTTVVPTQASVAAPAGSDPATCLQSAGTNFIGALNCLTPSGGSNPITSIVTQLEAASSSGGAPGISPTSFQSLASCVQGALTAKTPSASDVVGCIKTFSLSLTGAQQQLNCLSPILNGALSGVQGLAQIPPNATPLQAELTGLQAQLTALPTCLQGTAAAPVTGTTTSSGGATTPATTTAADPTEATPVAATPNFTG